MVDVLKDFHLPPCSIALGSVKSNFGHLKGAAGAAGMLKAALALHNKVLPPSLHCEHPSPDIDFAHSPLYVNTELKPWTVPADVTRRAGVSAFGFGGTNFHAVLEEYIPGKLNGNGKQSVAVTHHRRWLRRTALASPLLCLRYLLRQRHCGANGNCCTCRSRHPCGNPGFHGNGRRLLQGAVAWSAGDRRHLRRSANRASALQSRRMPQRAVHRRQPHRPNRTCVRPNAWRLTMPMPPNWRTNRPRR